MDKNVEKIIKIISIAVTTTGLMHILFQKKRKTTDAITHAGEGKGSNIVAGQGKGSTAFTPAYVEGEFKKFLLKKKNEGLPINKAKILEQIARMESRHFKSELLKRTNNIGAIISQQPNENTITVYVKPSYKNGVFVGNVITDENDKDAKPYHYRYYKTLDEGLEAFYNTVVANNYDYKKYSGDPNASLKSIRTPIVNEVYNI